MSIPEDIKWYNQLVSELSIKNYAINKGLVLLFDQLRFFLERGCKITKEIFEEILDNIEITYFHNSAMLYFLKKISEFVGLEHQELLEFFAKRRNFKIVRYLSTESIGY